MKTFTPIAGIIFIISILTPFISFAQEPDIDIVTDSISVDTLDINQATAFDITSGLSNIGANTTGTSSLLAWS